MGHVARFALSNTSCFDCCGCRQRVGSCSSGILWCHVLFSSWRTGEFSPLSDASATCIQPSNCHAAGLPRTKAELTQRWTDNLDHQVIIWRRSLALNSTSWVQSYWWSCCSSSAGSRPRSTLFLGRSRCVTIDDLLTWKSRNKNYAILFSRTLLRYVRSPYGMSRPSVVCDVVASFAESWTFRQYFCTA